MRLATTSVTLLRVDNVPGLYSGTPLGIKIMRLVSTLIQF